MEMNRTSLKPPRPVKATPVGGVNNLKTSLGALDLSTSSDQDAIVESVSPTRKSKVWNEPVYLKKRKNNTPLTHQLNHDYEPPPVLDETKTPLHIEVERGMKLFGDPIRMYPMFSNPRGYALIINNQEFDDPEMYPFREGAHVDSENLDKLFTQMGFTVIRCKNLKRRETLKKLDEIAEAAGSKASNMMVVCILSHGREQGKIVSTDGLFIDTEIDVLRKFNNDYCQELKGKPKFFIIQACRGDEQDYGYLSDYKGGVTETDATPSRGRRTSLPNQTYKELSWEDMLIAYSTLPGYVSNRDHYRGTWFIESICKVFMEHAKDMNLRDMLDEVGLVLSRYESEMGTKQSFNYDVRHFYKKLYFNPGIEIEPREHWKHSASIDFEEIQGKELGREEGEFLGNTIMKRTISFSGNPHQTAKT